MDRFCIFIFHIKLVLSVLKGLNWPFREKLYSLYSRKSKSGFDAFCLILSSKTWRETFTIFLEERNIILFYEVKPTRLWSKIILLWRKNIPKMALSISRASLFCTFFGVVIFCIFTISSYVHIHLLCKYFPYFTI